MATKIAVYNRALRNVGETKLSGIDEPREPRRLLDDAWGSGDEGVKECLSQGYWNFALRTREIAYNPSIEPDFGFRKVFDKPDDWVITANISANERFHPPLLQYKDEGAYWYTELETLYVQYVSNDSSYGGDLSAWPELFSAFVSWWLSKEIIWNLTGDEKKVKMVKDEYKKARSEARSSDALNQPTEFAPRGRWAGSRGGSRSRSDFGNPGSLTG